MVVCTVERSVRKGTSRCNLFEKLFCCIIFCFSVCIFSFPCSISIIPALFSTKFINASKSQINFSLAHTVISLNFQCLLFVHMLIISSFLGLHGKYAKITVVSISFFLMTNHSPLLNSFLSFPISLEYWPYFSINVTHVPP